MSGYLPHCEQTDVYGKLPQLCVADTVCNSSSLIVIIENWHRLTTNNRPDKPYQSTIGITFVYSVSYNIDIFV
jgi:hypothetical protein